MSPATFLIPTPQSSAPQPSTPPPLSAPLAASTAAPAPAVPALETHIYRGRTVEELLPKIQAELGSDAVVVRREKGLTGGVAGFFQRPFVEIEARRGTPAIDRYDEDGTPALPDALLTAAVPGTTPAPPGTSPMTAVLSPPAAVPQSTRGPWAAQPVDDGLTARSPEEFRELTTAGFDAEADLHSGVHAPMPIYDNGPFAAALAEAEAAVGASAFADATPVADASPVADDPQPLYLAPPATASPSGRTRASIERALTEAGIGEELARELIEAAAAHVLALMPGRPSLARAVHVALAQRIPSCPPLPAAGATIAVVGPGGSGKSALCAALHGAYRKRSTLPVTCAAIPLEAGQATKAALREARTQGMLLLDTPTCSPADPAAIRALTTLLGELSPDRVVLALPATLGARPTAQLLSALAPLKANALAITHADETDQLGVAVQAVCASGIAPAYLLGQPGRARTGGGLTPIDPAGLADRLLSPR